MFRISIILPEGLSVSLLDELKTLITRHTEIIQGFDFAAIRRLPLWAAWALGRYFVDEQLICIDRGFIEQSAEVEVTQPKNLYSPSVVTFWSDEPKKNEQHVNWWKRCDMFLIHRDVFNSFNDLIRKKFEITGKMVSFGEGSPDTNEVQGFQNLWLSYIWNEENTSIFEQINTVVANSIINHHEEVQPPKIISMKYCWPSILDNLKKVSNHIVLVDDRRSELDRLEDILLKFFKKNTGRQQTFIHCLHLPWDISCLSDRVAELFFEYKDCESFTVFLDSYFGVHTIDEQYKIIKEKYPWFGIIIMTAENHNTKETLQYQHPLGIVYGGKPTCPDDTEFFTIAYRAIDVGMMKLEAAKELGIIDKVGEDELLRLSEEKLIRKEVERIKKYLPQAEKKLKELLGAIPNLESELRPQYDDSFAMIALKIKASISKGLINSKTCTQEIRGIFGVAKGCNLPINLADKVYEKFKNEENTFSLAKLQWKEKLSDKIQYDKDWWTSFIWSGVVGIKEKRKRKTQTDDSVADDSVADKPDCENITNYNPSADSVSAEPVNDQKKNFGVIGNSSRMQEVFDMVHRVADSYATVLLRGESGTGKTLVAKALHHNSSRSGGPFVVVNCSALPETLLESELFGHEKGAFTDAIKSKKGQFETAEGGTLFLDEIGEISPAVQVKLLNVIQERTFQRLGSLKTITTNIRLVAATNRNLEAAVKEMAFREDLYFRLNVFPIYLPPLRERRTDILLLAEYFLVKYANENHKQIKRISTPAIELLVQHHWPGNVRELQNCMERAVLLCDGSSIDSIHLPSLPIKTFEEIEVGEQSEREIQKLTIDEQLTKQVISKCLKGNNIEKQQVANILGISEAKLNHLIKKLSIKATC